MVITQLKSLKPLWERFDDSVQDDASQFLLELNELAESEKTLAHYYQVDHRLVDTRLRKGSGPSIIRSCRCPASSTSPSRRMATPRARNNIPLWDCCVILVKHIRKDITLPSMSGLLMMDPSQALKMQIVQVWAIPSQWMFLVISPRWSRHSAKIDRQNANVKTPFLSHLSM